jgi:hypothetical protein
MSKNPPRLSLAGNWICTVGWLVGTVAGFVAIKALETHGLFGGVIVVGLGIVGLAVAWPVASRFRRTD